MTIPVGTAQLYAESLMRSTCTVRGRSTGRTTDPDSGEVVPTPGPVIYSGPCRVRPASGPSGDSSVREIGGAEMFTFDYLVTVPFSVSTVLEKQRVTIDSSPDPALVGRELEIQHVDRGESITGRRMQCNEVA